MILNIRGLSRFTAVKNLQKVQFKHTGSDYSPFLSGHNRDSALPMCLTINALSMGHRDSSLSRNRDNKLSRLYRGKTLCISGLTCTVSRLCPDFGTILGPYLSAYQVVSIFCTFLSRDNSQFPFVAPINSPVH
jgi:hypothetical protein